jgi:uncharacterized membrane protein
MDDLGWKFWLWFAGVGVAFVIGAVLIFVLISGAWMRWGFFGTLLVLFLIALVGGWIYDRRQQKRERELSELVTPEA